MKTRLVGMLVSAVNKGKRRVYSAGRKATREPAMALIIFEPVRMPEKMPAAKMSEETRKILAPCDFKTFCWSLVLDS